MIYYTERHETIDRHHEGCLSLGCAGKFIAFIELLFYAFIFYSIKSHLSCKLKEKCWRVGTLGRVRIRRNEQFTLEFFCEIFENFSLFRKASNDCTWNKISNFFFFTFQFKLAISLSKFKHYF